MQSVSVFVLLPLMIGLLMIAFCEELRRRVLAVSLVAKAEEKLGRLSRYYWLAFVLIMAAGVFSRCYRFVELPLGINQDGLMAGAEAYSLLMNGTDQFGTSYPTYFEAWGFSQMSTLYSYLLMPFYKLFGMSKFTLRLPMLLTSLTMLPLIWDFARRIAGKGYALAVLFLVATSPWHMLQSRWALEANLMPHVLLTGVYLLYLGMEKRWALYLSMVFFGLAPYAYGVACFTVPVFLVLAAIYYLARKKVRVMDTVLCVVIFVGVAGPYFYTMAINAFGWETKQIGMITMPLFENSLRARDMAFSQENPYYTMVWNLFSHLGTWLLGHNQDVHNAIPWAHALYRFMPPVMLCGMYLAWRDRRNLARFGQETQMRDGFMLLLLWFGAAMFNGVMIGGVMNRNNALFYPLLFLGAYALAQMGRRLRTALAVLSAIVVFSFAALNVSYFKDETYQDAVGEYFSDGLYEVLTDTWDWDYDYYYVFATGEPDGAHMKVMNANVMFAHQIDYRGRNEEILLKGPDGQEIDWYYGERYIFTDYTDFEPDPMECAVYIIPGGQKELFNPEEYLITDYGNYAAAYPRYWAE